VRYGLTLDSGKPIADITAEARDAAEAGIASAAMSQIFGYDALTVFAAVGQQVPDLELVSAVIPTYPRHPLMLAAQALTVQAVIGDRLTLGVGLSHKIVIEGVFGYSFDHPARHMDEYLQVLVPLLHGEGASLQGESVKAGAPPLTIDGVPAPRVLVAALGETMLRIAGRRTDGTITWMTGPRTIADHTVPIVSAAAAEAGRPAPRVSVSLPVCVTDDVDGAREQANNIFAIYGQLPSYRAMLDREGAAGPGDVAVVGDADAVARQLGVFAEAGATDFVAAAFGSPEERRRTNEVVAELSRAGAGSAGG
jgi:5,10-methylenetetrahydromethanopterin reductase